MIKNEYAQQEEHRYGSENRKGDTVVVKMGMFPLLPQNHLQLNLGYRDASISCRKRNFVVLSLNTIVFDS